eukprot:197320_1
MDIEISERDGHESDENVLSPTSPSNDNNFVDEFLDKVSIKTIMSGSRCIGGNEARLMLAQFRECNIDIVTYEDPGVIMLDGVAISELEEYLLSGGESLEYAIRGPKEDLILQSDNNRNKKTATLSQLRTILSNFRKTIDINDKNSFRQEFFITYNQLNNGYKNAIQPQIRSQIENTIYLDSAHQETLLMTLVLPSEAEENKFNISSVEGMIQQTGSTGGGNTTSFGERYRGSMGYDDGNNIKYQQYTMRARVASLQGKNLREWLFSNLNSQHVWFFISGFFLFWIFFIQTWVDYAFGEMWRALLMELLCLASLLMMMMEADTEFIRMTIQERLYNYYQFLSTVEGRTYFYTFLCFLAFGKFTIYDIMAIIGGCILLLLTVTRFILYQWSETCIDDFIITLRDSTKIRKIFKKLDEDADGYLLLKDIDNMVDAEFAKCCCCRGWLKEIIFWRIDNATNDGKIDIHEFVQFCLNFKSKQQINKYRRDSRKGLTQSIDMNNINTQTI